LVMRVPNLDFVIITGETDVSRREIGGFWLGILIPLL